MLWHNIVVMCLSVTVLIPSRFVLLCKLSLLHTLDWCELTAWRHTRYSLRAADWWSDWRHHGRHISLLAALLSLARTVYSSNATFHDDILMVTWHVLGTGPGNGNAAVAVTAASLTTLVCELVFGTIWRQLYWHSPGVATGLHFGSIRPKFYDLMIPNQILSIWGGLNTHTSSVELFSIA